MVNLAPTPISQYQFRLVRRNFSLECTVGTLHYRLSVSVVTMLLVEVRVAGENNFWLSSSREDWLAGVESLRLLTLGKADDAACDAGALSLSVAALTVVGLLVLGLVVIVLSLVDDHGAADDGVGSAKVDEQVSVLVLGVSVETSLNHLNITNTSVVDVLVRVATVGTEWVIDLTSRLATVLQIAELVDLEGVETWLESLELTNDGGKIMGLLSELNSTAGVGVSEEVELARGDDLLVLLGGGFPVVVDWLNVVSLDISGADGAATHPWETVRVAVAIGVLTVGGVVVVIAIAGVMVVVAVSVVVGIVVVVNAVEVSTGVAGAEEGLKTRVAIIVTVLLSSVGTHDKGEGESDLGQHFDFSI